MKATHYSVVRKKKVGPKAKIDTKQLSGYQVKPKNSKKYGQVEVNSMTLINPTFIEKVLKKKNQKKLDYYLTYIIQLVDDEEDSDSTNLMIALNDLTHYKSIINHKYRKFLDEKYINLLLKKIDILEHEIKKKLKAIQYQYYESLYYTQEQEEEKGKAR